jgi:hypothetical protein
VEIVGGVTVIPRGDPFDGFASLFDSVPLRIGAEGLEDKVARETDDGGWSATVFAVTVETDKGRIRLAVGRPVEIRSGARIVDKTPESLEGGDRLLIGRRHGRLGLLEALEERLRLRRPDLLVGRLLIDSYQKGVRERFVDSGFSIAELRRRLAAVGCDKTTFAIRSWVVSDGTLAPRDEPDLRRLNEVLGLGMSDTRLDEVFAAVQRRRGFRRAAGRILAEAARSSTLATDRSRVDTDTGLSIADLNEAVVEAVVVSVDHEPTETPISETGRLEEM